MTDEDAFHAAIDANPADGLTRMVFADWLEERGDPRAEGYRVMGELGVVGCDSYAVYDSPKFEWYPDGPMAWWGNFDPGRDWFTNTLSLPLEWLEAIGCSLIGTPRSADFPDRRAAENAAALAWATLPEDARTRIRRDFAPDAA